MNEKIYLGLSIVTACYSQLVIKWKSSDLISNPNSIDEILGTLWVVLTNVWVLSAIFATFISGISWILAISKMELTDAYPWTLLIFVLINVSGFCIFGEELTVMKLVSISLICLGLLTLSINK